MTGTILAAAGAPEAWTLSRHPAEKAIVHHLHQAAAELVRAEFVRAVAELAWPGPDP